MEQKILEGLKKSYTNLGLSEKVLEQYAKMLAKMAGEVAEEEQDAKVTELVADAKDMLTSVQSFGDSRAAKSNKGGKKDEDEDEDENRHQHGGDDEMKALMKELRDSLKQSQDRIAALEGARNKDTREDLIKSIAKELGLTGKPLEYAKAVLSDEMDETAIRNSLGKSKKDFVKMGLPTDQTPEDKATREQQVRSDAEKWVEEFKAQQEAANK